MSPMGSCADQANFSRQGGPGWQLIAQRFPKTDRLNTAPLQSSCRYSIDGRFQVASSAFGMATSGRQLRQISQHEPNGTRQARWIRCPSCNVFIRSPKCRPPGPRMQASSQCAFRLIVSPARRADSMPACHAANGASSSADFATQKLAPCSAVRPISFSRCCKHTS